MKLYFENKNHEAFYNGFVDTLAKLAPSYDAEEDMINSGTPHPVYHLNVASANGLFTDEQSAYEAGKKAAEAVAEDIERMCAEEKAMKEEEEEDLPF